MNIAICDDDSRIVDLIEDYIEEYCRENAVLLSVEVFSCGEDLIKYMETGHQVDLLFLDIVFINGMSGVEVGDVIRNRLDNQILKLVYVSGYQVYDRQLFAYQPMNFIEKPIKKEKVYEDIDRARRLLNIGESVFCYQRGRGTETLKYRDIMYFESNGRKIVIYTRFDKIDFYGKLKDIAPQVLAHRFVQIHRSYFVNYDYIIRVERKRVILNDETSINIGETYRKEVQSLMINLEKGEE